MSEFQKKPIWPTIQNLLGWLVLVALLTTIIWNNEQLSWSQLYWLLFPVLTILIRLPFSIQTKDNNITFGDQSGQEQFLMLFLFVTMAPLPMLFLVSKSLGWDLFNFADYALSENIVMIGAFLIVPFAVLFWRSHSDLGKNWSAKLEMREEHELVTTGVYKHVRHPMYSAIWLLAIAQPLLLHNWIGGFLVIPAFSALHVLRIPREEAMMTERFGDTYLAYKQNTGRVFPRLF